MKINFIKLEGGILTPASDYEEERLKKFKTGEVYEVEIKLSRNPKFHRKMFAFFNHCFHYWKGDKEFIDEVGQFDVFRKNLTVLAGYYREYYNMKGEMRIEAQSLSFGSMDQEQFEQVYSAITQAATNALKGRPSI